MKALVYHGPDKKALEDVRSPRSSSRRTRLSKSSRPRSAAPTCISSKVTCRLARPAASSVTRDRRGRQGRRGSHRVSRWRSRNRVVHLVLRKMRLLPSRHVLALRQRRLDLGNKIDGTQAEFVRIPFADTSLYRIPSGADEDALVMLSDILPTGFECGVLNGKVQPGSSIAIVGAGPIGLAALLTAQFYSPAEIIMIDLDDNRLQLSSRFGATTVINNKDGKAVEKIMKMTDGRGVVPPSKRSEYPRVSSPARISWRRAASSPISACTASRPTYILSDCGTATSRLRRIRRHRHYPDAAQDGAVAPDRSKAADHASFQTRQDHGRLRHVRRRGQDQCAQSAHRSVSVLTAASNTTMSATRF